MQLKTIKVYGRLRKFLGSSYFEAAVSSPAEAIRFLMCNFPEVEAHMSQQYYKVKMNNMDVSLDFLSMKGRGDIQIIPIATGSLPAVTAVFGGIASGAAVVATAASGSSICHLSPWGHSSAMEVHLPQTPSNTGPKYDFEDYQILNYYLLVSINLYYCQ